MARYGPAFCFCVAKKYVATFSAVQLPLTLVSKPLKEAGRAITSECALIASMQDEYNRLTAALSAHSDLAVTAYLTRDFVDIDIRGRAENARQMLSRIDSRPKGGAEMTTILSAHTSGNRIAVHRKTLEGAETVAAGKRRIAETLTFFSDIWRVTDGTWLLERSKVNIIETYVNGRRVSRTKSARQAE